MTQGTDLPNLSSPAAKNISLFDLVETAIKHLPSRAHQEGRYASSRTWSAGCDGRFRCARRARRKADGEVVAFWYPDAGIKSAAMLLHRGLRRRQQSPVSGETTKETVKTIAQGMPECFGQPVVTMLVCSSDLRTRLRVRLSARHSLRPLLVRGTSTAAKLGRSSSRESGRLSCCRCHFRRRLLGARTAWNISPLAMWGLQIGRNGLVILALCG